MRTWVSSTRQDLLVSLRCRRTRWSSSGPYRCTQRQTVVSSACSPRSSRSDSECRKCQRTAQRIRTRSICRYLKIAVSVAILGSFQATSPHSGHLQHIRSEVLTLCWLRRYRSQTPRQHAQSESSTPRGENSTIRHCNVRTARVTGGMPPHGSSYNFACLAGASGGTLLGTGSVSYYNHPQL